MTGRLAEGARVRLKSCVQSDFRKRAIPAGSLGVIVEAYQDPPAYAVDFEIPNADLVGCVEYENVVVRPDELELLSPPTVD